MPWLGPQSGNWFLKLMYRAHCCEQYRAHDRKPDSTVLKQIAARLVEQFRGDVPADLDLTIAEARARQWEEARRMAARRKPGIGV